MTLAQRGWYTFAVEKKARKEEIAKTISKLYGVDVRVIRTIKKVGKAHRTGKKMIALKKSDWKKAMVKLKKGQRIPVFEVTGETAKA